MRKFFNIIILSGVVFSTLMSGFAQERAATEQELNALEKNAYEKLKGKTYRITMVSRHYKNAGDSSPYYFANEVSEYVAPDRKRDVREVTNEKGANRTETISIGQRKYIKQNNESWKELKSSSDRSFGGFTGKTLNHETKVEVKYRGKTAVKNQNADLYEITKIRSYDDPKFRSTTVSTDRFWFNKDGMFLKRENESNVDNVKFIVNIVWEYEYDPNIKIEAPIVKSETPLTMIDPRVKTRNVIPKSAPVIAALSTNDEILLNSEKISEDKIVAELVKLMEAKSPDQEVVYIKADANADYGNIVEFVKLARKAEIDDFGFMTANEGKEDVSKAVGVMAVLEEFLEGDDSKPGPLFLTC